MSRSRLETTADAEQLADTLAVARFAPLLVLCLAACTLPLFWLRPERVIAGILFAILLALAVGATLVAVLFDPRGASASVLQIGRKIGGGLALAIGLAAGAIPLALLPAAAPEHRLILATMAFGVISIAPLFGPSLPVCQYFLVPVVIGTVGGALRLGDVTGGVVAMMAFGFGGLILLACRRLYRTSLQVLVGRLTADERDDRLDLFPQDDANATGLWFWQTDAALRLRHVSPFLAAVVDRRPGQLEGKTFEKLFLGPAASLAPSRSAEAILAFVKKHETFQGKDVEHRTDDGTSVWWRMTGRPVVDLHGAFAGYRGVGWDVSALYLAATRMAHLASHDPLTGLHRREDFLALVARECRTAIADRSARALLILDIDAFREINDAHGYAGGDALLKAVATRLRGAAPRTATVARLGGDQFALLYAPSHASNARTLARALGTALQAPFEIPGSEVSVHVSTGVAVAPEHAIEADGLFRKADLALSRGKRQGKGGVTVYTPEFEHALVVQREFEDDIKLALARGEFQLHYQPLLDLADGKITGFEALLRWSSPTRGPVSPVDFIPVAEAGGLIIAIGRFVLLEACRAAALWHEPARVAVNISPKHLRSPDFMADVTTALRLTGLSPTRLEIEITEGVFLENAAEAVGNLAALRARGIRVALDDFGTGYSSLNYLTNFPVDKIKIDRSFIAHFLDRTENRTIVEAILTLARKLGLVVTAEGVETAEQALALKLRRCDQIQGYLVSKAMPADTVNAMFTTVPGALRAKLPALFESTLAAAVAMRTRSAA